MFLRFCPDRISVYAIQIQASDMGYELFCLLNLFVLLDRMTICSWVSCICVSLCIIQIREQNCYIWSKMSSWAKIFLLTQCELERLVLPSLAHHFSKTSLQAVACFQSQVLLQMLQHF